MEFQAVRKAARKRLLEMHFHAGVGHIGGNLSCLDLLLTLYHRVLTPTDSVVLSKGHSAGALYISLWSIGKIADEELSTFHRDSTRLSGHPPANVFPDIPFATGSLGHGLSLAAGMALGLKLRQSPGTVYCVMSDGEWNEGSCWEALIFAVQNKLDNLIFIVDSNGLQGFGTTQEVANLSPLEDKFQSFGAAATVVDGHDSEKLLAAIQAAPASGRPRAILAQTRKGFGVSFMENKMEWHYLPMNREQFTQALNELESGELLDESERLK